MKEAGVNDILHEIRDEQRKVVSILNEILKEIETYVAFRKRQTA